MIKANRFSPVGLFVLLAAVAVSTAVAVSGLSAQTTLGIEFRDDSSDDAAITEIVLDGGVDDFQVVQVHITGTIDPDVNAVQVSIEHDDSIVSITPSTDPLAPFCDGAFVSPFVAPSGRDESDQLSWFVCGLNGSVGTPSTGLIMNLLITRESTGEPTLTFVMDGLFETKLVEPGPPTEEHRFTSFGSLTVLEAAPTPTPVPTTPSGGGGGGGSGGGGFIPGPPAPTATPAGPVLLAPGVPSGVTATPVVDGVQISWDAPDSDGGDAITGYRVLVIPSAQVVNVPSGQTEVTVTGLDPAQAYQFQVNASNTVGAGPGSPLTAPVSPLEPLGAPQGVAASLGADGVSALVSWQAPTSTGSGPITGYTVMSEPPVGSGVAVEPDVTSVTFEGLAFDTSYTFTVTASNADGPGPASGPAGPVVTGPPLSGSPDDEPETPEGSPTKPEIDASEEDLDDFEDAISDAFGSPVNLDDGAPSITPVDGGLVVEFPIEPGSEAMEASGSISSTVGNLQLDITDGAGTAKILIDEAVSITGPATLGSDTDAVQVQIDDPQLAFSPAAPEEFGGGGGLVTQVGADFGVAMNTLPDDIGLTAEFIEDVAEVPDAVTSFQLAASDSGGEIEDPESDIAFVVVVDKQGVSNDQLGDNTVTLTVSRAWYENRLMSGKSIFITKVGDDGAVHTSAATCEVDGEIVRCTAVFTGDAGGFSLFGVVALRPVAEASTPTPTPTPAATAVAPTATPTPVPSPTATPSPIPPTATAVPEPTATPLTLVAPTSDASDVLSNTEQVLPENDDGGIPEWALILIVIAGSAVLIPAVGAAYRISRRQTG